jgi:F-type H+-transporting ATPase subunit b
MLFQLLIIQVITFAVLLFVLRILFYKQLGSALARLKNLHEENLAREEELKKELEKARLEKEQELKKAREEADKIIKDSKTKAEKISLDADKQAKEKVESALEQMQQEKEKLEKELLAKYQQHAIDLSLEMLDAVFTDQGREALQHQLIMELIGELKNLEKDKFTVRGKEAKVTSAYPLTDGEKEKLAHILSDKVGERVALQESKDAGIIAGLIINIGALTIDGSLKSKLKKTIPYLKAGK